MKSSLIIRLLTVLLAIGSLNPIQADERAKDGYPSHVGVFTKRRRAELIRAGRRLVDQGENILKTTNIDFLVMFPTLAVTWPQG